MYIVIYTKSLDNAEDIEVKCWEFKDPGDAEKMFRDKVNEIVQMLLKNSLLHGKISIFANKALVKVEGTHYTVAITM